MKSELSKMFLTPCNLNKICVFDVNDIISVTFFFWCETDNKKFGYINYTQGSALWFYLCNKMVSERAVTKYVYIMMYE
jgi:hypothetical protein